MRALRAFRFKRRRAMCAENRAKGSSPFAAAGAVAFISFTGSSLTAVGGLELLASPLKGAADCFSRSLRAATICTALRGYIFSALEAVRAAI